MLVRFGTEIGLAPRQIQTDSWSGVLREGCIVNGSNHAQGLRAACLGLAALVVFGATAAGASGDPDFGAVTWTSLDCIAGGDPVGDESPSTADLVGDASHPATYYARDAKYLYFRYRLDGNPATKGGFVQNIWSALLQIPSGNPKQYQYEIAVNGKNDDVELWANTSAVDLSFTPNFNDPAETRLFAQSVSAANGSTVNTTPLVRSIPVDDGSAFGGTPDYFLDFAMPISVLVSNGVIADAGDLANSLYAPATSTTLANYNKDHLDCGFRPGGNLSVEATMTPDTAAVNVTTPVVYTFTVHNDGPVAAKGVEIDGNALPSYMTNPSVDVSSDGGAVVATVQSANPLKVTVPTVPAGSTVTVRLSSDVRPGCGDADFTEQVTVSAANFAPVTYSATFTVNRAVRETCDGVDNDCDGQVDGDNLCDDGNACTVDSCHGTGGCTHDTIPGCEPCTTASDCNDRNACTTDSCVAGACTHDAIGGCEPCTTASDCNDRNACTTDSCVAGACTHDAISGCEPCTTASDCNDHSACTTDSCVAGTCTHSAIGGCEPCTTASDCNNHDACTTGSCTAGTCTYTAIGGCEPCTTAADCEDHDTCTADTCTAGVCAHTAVPDCRPSTKPVEICGDCIDNDGDGLVDWEDPDCCEQLLAMQPTRVMLKRPSAKGRNRMRLRVVYSPFTPAGFDPTGHDTSLQISDDKGQVVCATVAGSHWMHPTPRRYSFCDKDGTFAGGLRDGRFVKKKNGRVIFRAISRKLPDQIVDGRNVRITVRVGNQCSQSTMELRAKKKALVYP